jgi:septal ring factor EnvC (AmiA/AmiB activator)
MFRRVLIATLLIATAAVAQSPKPADELGQVEAEQQARESERAEALREADQAHREIAELTAQLNELTTAQAHGEGVVSEKRLKLAALNARDAELAARAGANSNRLAHLLGALQMFSREPPPALLLHADDARDAVRAAILIKAMTPDLEHQARAFAAQAEAAKAARRDAAAQSEDLFSAESDVADRASKIQSLLVEKTRLEQGLTGEATAAGQQIADLSARAEALRAVLGRLPAAPDLPDKPVGPKSLQPPLPGDPSVRFGDTEAGGHRSEGWTWTAATGARVAAPAAGLVDYAGPVEGWKTVVILNLGGNTRLVLTGLDLPLVEVGQSVTQGQVIGRMAEAGHLGVSSGGELHLEVRKNRQTVDPATLMARR